MSERLIVHDDQLRLALIAIAGGLALAIATILFRVAVVLA